MVEMVVQERYQRRNAEIKAGRMAVEEPVAGSYVLVMLFGELWNWDDGVMYSGLGRE
jgi:hypothetical protein